MLFDIKLDLHVSLEQQKRQIFAPNAMAIRDQRHDNKSKTKQRHWMGFDVTPPIDVASRSRDLMFFIGK